MRGKNREDWEYSSTVPNPPPHGEITNRDRLPIGPWAEQLQLFINDFAPGSPLDMNFYQKERKMAFVKGAVKDEGNFPVWEPAPGWQ